MNNKQSKSGNTGVWERIKKYFGRIFNKDDSCKKGCRKCIGCSSALNKDKYSFDIKRKK